MTTDEEKLVNDNINLAYKLAWKYYTSYNYKYELEELQSICNIGLVLAAKTFNPELEFNFSTYAYTCMKNELGRFMIYEKRHTLDTYSLYENLSEDLQLKDIIEDENNDLFDLDKLFLINKLKVEVDKLPEKYKKIIEYKLQGYTFKDMMSLLHKSNQQIGVDYQKALNILRTKFKDWR